MKGRKSGGRTESPAHGDKDWVADAKTKPAKFTPGSKVNAEAEKRASGGRAGRKHGGAMKEVGSIKGGAPSKHAGRMPRKSGGRAGGSNFNPLSSAASGTPAKGHTATGAKG